MLAAVNELGGRSIAVCIALKYSLELTCSFIDTFHFNIGFTPDLLR